MEVQVVVKWKSKKKCALIENKNVLQMQVQSQALQVALP